MKLQYILILCLSMGAIFTATHAMESNHDTPNTNEEKLLLFLTDNTLTQEDVDRACRWCPDLAHLFQGNNLMGKFLTTSSKMMAAEVNRRQCQNDITKELNKNLQQNNN